MVETQLKVERLGYLDTGDDDVDPDSGGYEEATDMLGKMVYILRHNSR